MADPNSDTRLRKSIRWGVRGAAGGAALGGLASYALTRSLPVGLYAGAHAGAQGGAIGAALGALTYRKRKQTELSEILSRIINFESITYHETAAERHQRKATVHREKGRAGLSVGGVAASGALTVVAEDGLRDIGSSAIKEAGKKIVQHAPKNPALAGIGKFGHLLAKHPTASLATAAFAPAVGFLGYGVGHKIAGWSQTNKANSEFMKANEARKKRNATMSRRNLSAILDAIIEFKTSDTEKRARWAAVGGGITGATTGAALGGYVGAANPKVLGVYAKEVGSKLSDGLQSGINDAIGDSWKNEGMSKPFETGVFGPAEREARLGLLKNNLVKRAAIRHISKTAAIGAGVLGTVGALGGYAASKGGLNKKRDNVRFSAADDIEPVRETMTKESKKRALELLYEKMARGGSHRLSSVLDDLIQFKAPVVTKTVQDIGTTPLGLEVIKRHNQIKAEAATAREKLKKSKALKQLLQDHFHLLNSKLDTLIHFDDIRARSPQTGEFEPEGENGPNPNSMASVYKQPAPVQSPGISAGKAAGAALAGGALGAIGSNVGKTSWAAGRKMLRDLAARKKSKLIH